MKTIDLSHYPGSYYTVQQIVYNEEKLQFEEVEIYRNDCYDKCKEYRHKLIMNGTPKNKTIIYTHRKINN